MEVTGNKSEQEKILWHSEVLDITCSLRCLSYQAVLFFIYAQI